MTTGRSLVSARKSGRLDEEAPAEERRVRVRLREAIGRLREGGRAGRRGADRVAQQLRVEHLLGVVPLVERLGLVEPLVALQAHEVAVERFGQRARQVRLANAGGPLDEQRPLEHQRQPRHERQAIVGEVAGAREALLEIGLGHDQKERLRDPPPSGKWLSWAEMTSPRDVRVDRNGTVVPVGGAASDDLRRRAGDWRLLSSPPEVLLAARPNARPLRLAGEVRTPGALCEVIAIIAQGGLGGELAVHAPEGERSLYFDRGNVVGARSQVDGERLGEILWRFTGPSRATSTTSSSRRRRSRASASARPRSTCASSDRTSFST